MAYILGIVILLGLGVFILLAGWGARLKKRLIEDIPASWVRSVASGLCKIHGKAKPRTNSLRGPLSNAPCVFYKYLIERYEKSWKTVAQDDSSHVFFLIDDGTGQALINPAGAELDLEAPHFHYKGGGSFERHLPDNLIAFLDSRGIEYENWFERFSVRFQEWTIDEQDELFVLGTAHKGAVSTSDFTKRLQAAIDELKSNPQDLKKADTDKDGQISVGEWNAAVNAIRQDLLEEEVRNLHAAGFPDTVISQGGENRNFIISKRSEKRFCARSGLFSFLGVFVGAALCIAAAVLLFGGVRSALSDSDKGGPVFPKMGGATVPLDIETQGKGIKAGKGAANQTIYIKSDGRRVEILTHSQEIWRPGDSFEILPNGQVKKGWIPGFKETLAPNDVAGILSVIRGAGDQLREFFKAPKARTVYDELADTVEKLQAGRK